MGEPRADDATRLSDRIYSLANLDLGIIIASRVRVAGTSTARRKGLLGVNRLDPGDGLWINPCEAIHTFGMKFALDVLFLDRDFRVRKIVHSLPPNRISFCVSASSVIELAPGIVLPTGTERGQILLLRAE